MESARKWRPEGSGSGQDMKTKFCENGSIKHGVA
jgi:hypothetical protein